MREVRIKLFMVVLVLICIGIVMIYSASSVYATERYGDSFFFLKRHLVFVLIGFAVTFAAMAVDYNFLKKHSKEILLLSLLLLILVLIPGIGREVSGARRWFRLKFISFQPAEFAAIAMIIYVSDFISRKTEEIRESWRGFLPVILVLGFTLLLILLQPDLGTSLSIACVAIAMLFVGGVGFRYIAGMFLASIPALYALIFSVPYRRSRIMAFLNPWADPKGIGFQIIQSQIALGSGGLFGVGLGHSKQKLFYLPAAHTDFIFSIIGEELGLLGTIAVIVLFIIFIRLGLKVVRSAPDKFGYYLGLGVILMIALKAAVNIGVSCGVLPTKGLPLPLISYGGSSLVFDLMGVGLLMNIAREAQE